jgi:streptomycin 6-kinase
MTNSNLEPYLMRWRLEPDGAAIETLSSWLLPVKRDRSAAMLKVLKPSSDERNAAGLLRYLNGDGAVRLYEADENALRPLLLGTKMALAPRATMSAASPG